MHTPNEQRSDRAFRLMLVYSQYTHANEMETTVTDLLADLLHMSEDYNINIADCLRVATDHYNEETQESPCNSK